jgi:hypothetical protein
MFGFALRNNFGLPRARLTVRVTHIYYNGFDLFGVRQAVAQQPA